MNRASRRRQKKLLTKSGRLTASKGPATSNPADIQKALGLALQYHNAGRLPEAEGIYQQILETDPVQHDAMHLLGLVAHQVGKSDIAVDLITQALAIKPDFPEAYNNLGNALKNLGKLDEAVASYHKALKFMPNFAAAHNNLGLTLIDMGKLDEAVSSWRMVLIIDPNHVDARYNLGKAFSDLGKYEEAIDSFQKALADRPDYAEAHNSLGDALQKRGLLEEAVYSFNRAIAINPGYADAYNNLGGVFQDPGRLDEAVASHHKAIAIDPNSTAAYNNLGHAFKYLGKLDEALNQYERALDLNPVDDVAHNNMSTMLLMRGELEKGWEEYEWRWKRTLGPILQRNFPQQRWDGEALQDKSILLWGEQGLGDEICFASMVPDVVSMGAHCVIECEPRLVDLFARSFPEVRVHARHYAEAENGTKGFDFQIPMGSLPAYFRKSIADFPDKKGFLIADGDQQKMWQDRLSELGSGLKVGIAWRSGVINQNRRATHYAEIADLKPLFDLKDTVFINLQYGECADEIAEIREQFGITLHTWDDIDMTDDLDDVSALISCLDVIVCPMISVFSMGAALGITTLVFCRSNSNWMSLGTEGIPFHPSVRLFKRNNDESWEQVFSDITGEIDKLSGISPQI